MLVRTEGTTETPSGTQPQAEVTVVAVPAREEGSGGMPDQSDQTPPGLDALLDLCARYLPPADLDLIRAAYAVAARAHHGTKRVSGEPFIEHPLAVARILANLALDAAGIVAALLHDTVEDTAVTLAEIERDFGPAIASIVDGVTKFELVGGAAPGDGPHPEARPPADRRAQQQKETVRKLLVAMIRDPRVVLLKLADRLHNLRTLDVMAPAQRAAKARETLEIYAPLAGRIGFQLAKSELEDLAFSHLDPAACERVCRILQAEAKAGAAWAERIAEAVQRRLRADGIPAAVNWRLKRPYRAWVEMRESGMPARDLHDLIAFRVLVNTELECYRALGVIHSLWHPMESRIRDYIAIPKLNGYRSLHTAVFAFDGRKAQFHIRTHEMHRRVQHGVTAHWLERAACGAQGESALGLAVEDLPGWLAQLDGWHRELRLSADAFVDALKSEVFDDQVFVFTPKGQMIDLPAGSTPLDLAYRIHSDLGDHFSSARVQTVSPDGLTFVRYVSPEYQLHTGDVIAIRTDPAARPQAAWLELVHTHNAREKLHRALRAAARQDARATDGLPSAESEPELTLERSPESPEPTAAPHNVRLARCCYPCPHDRIVGLAGRARALTVHRACCRTLRSALARRRHANRADNALELEWRGLPALSFRMAIAIHGQDHAGLMHELARGLKSLEINLTSSSAVALQDRKKAIVTLICELPHDVRPETVFRRLHAIPGITRVERDTSLGCDQDLHDTLD
jgi:GTP pyrophosphokinase